MQTSFWKGAREGFRSFFPLSVGLIPWALVTGIAMTTNGLTLFQAMGMNMIVYAGTAQLATLPLIAAGAPLWLIVATALVLNLRFIIFSAAIAPGFRETQLANRWFSGYLLTDAVFANCLDKMLTAKDPNWRLGYYLAPSLWSWILWQVFGLTGVLAARSIPPQWSLEFMASIALIVLLVPMAKLKPMLVAALTGGTVAVALHTMPLRLGIFIAILAGIGAGFFAERWQDRKQKGVEA